MSYDSVQEGILYLRIQFCFKLELIILELFQKPQNSQSLLCHSRLLSNITGFKFVWKPGDMISGLNLTGILLIFFLTAAPSQLLLPDPGTWHEYELCYENLMTFLLSYAWFFFYLI